MNNPFSDLSRFERVLWVCSLLVVALSFAAAGLLSGAPDPLSMAASLIGVTALIFVSKGYVLGQVLTVIFALFYGAVSFHFRYYGEMITYLGMTAPVALCATVSWIRHPYRKSREVTVSRVSPRQSVLLVLLTGAVTAGFYFLLAALDTGRLAVSTVSVATSFLASSLTVLRSPFYACAYAANDVVLILLWIFAAAEDPAYLPMTACFFMFLCNDLYGFHNWRVMQKRQRGPIDKSASGMLQ